MSTKYMIVLYVAAMVAANLLVYVLGKWSSPFIAFMIIGFDLTMRDVLHARLSRWGMLGVIAVGGLVTWGVNPSASNIALASAVAFSVAAIIDYAVFSVWRGSWLARSNASNVAGALADSLIFPTIAFGGFLPEIVVLQFAAKVAGGYVWSLALKRCASL